MKNNVQKNNGKKHVKEVKKSKIVKQFDKEMKKMENDFFTKIKEENLEKEKEKSEKSEENQKLRNKNQRKCQKEMKNNV